MIQPQDKRAAETIQVSLPATYMDRVKAHGKELSESSPEYVVGAIVQDYFDAGRDREATSEVQPKDERTPRRKKAKNKAVILPSPPKKEVA